MNAAKSSGIKHIEAAIAAEDDKDLRRALSEYESGLGLLMQAMKLSSSSSERGKLKKLVSQYMERAEYIKHACGDYSEEFQRSKARKSGKGVPKAMRSLIEREIIEDRPTVRMDQIAGLRDVKQILYESVILPASNPSLFTGLRAPPKGLLLFGPPGNGKTMIAKALASECQAAFFNISASSLTSKYVGESEKLVRAMFALARERQPSIIFIDEVDSILGARNDNENESARRLKTEFLVGFDGVGSDDNDRLLIIGATNLPSSLDEAIKRRFARRVYVPMPTADMRIEIFKKVLEKQTVKLSRREYLDLGAQTEGYSAADIKEICRDAAMGPVRGLKPSEVSRIRSHEIPPITYQHFCDSISSLSPSVSSKSILSYETWNAQYGSKYTGRDASMKYSDMSACQLT